MSTTRTSRKASPPFVVAVGGFDPSCGAGVVADARSIEAMGAVPLAVATSITVQSGRGLRSFRAVAPRTVLAQLEELLSSLPVAAVKIGQVPTPALARQLGSRLSEEDLPVVLDPVIEASGGGRLASPAAVAQIAKSLVPRASVLTVNLAEASVLCARRIRGIAGMRRAAEDLERAGAQAVLVKGGHLAADPVDLLRRRGRTTELRASRIPGSVHGSGCALASAIAARLAFGDGLDRAVAVARRHVRQLLRAPVVVGSRRFRPPRAH